MEREEKICVIVIILIVVAIVSYFGYDYYRNYTESLEAEKERSALFIEEGDTITFEVTAWLDDFKVFYTTEQSVDEDTARLKSPNYNFFSDEAEIAVVGEELSSKFTEGLTEQILYLKIDDKKIIKVTPDKGFGWSNETLIKKIPLSDSMPLYTEMLREEFQSFYNPEDIPLFIGQRFNHTYWNWPIEVVEVYNESVKFRHEPLLNQDIDVLPWSAKVTGISEKDNKLFILHEPNQNQLDETIDPIELSEYDDEFITIQDIQSELNIGIFTGIIVDIDKDYITLDFNDEKAGKNIYYEVKILNIIKP
jgi:FKBP-type peptidyl-prolyl cis-trans isomerase 2